ncbi:MAG: DNA translocase FtsK 4TM domain-containing protein [Burkholderiales bacterium]
MLFRRAERQSREPLPPRLARLVREAWWLVLIGAGTYLTLILATYRRSDPGWSQSVPPEAGVANAGGRVGAWISDVLLYLLGGSAWWFVVLCGAGVYGLYRRLEPAEPATDRRPMMYAVAGFFVCLFASSGFEALRLHTSSMPLPYRPGGLIGKVLSQALLGGFGFTGGTLVLIIALAAGFSLFAGVSWLTVAERLGGGIERVLAWGVRRWSERRDREIGEEATIERETAVEVKREILVEERIPIHIEPPVVAIPKSKRVEKEKQKPLFEDLPDSPLPPLQLLDEPDQKVEVLSAEVLEYTSRLIEKKLLDFGIEVKVLAAYPGPVITRYEIEPATGVKGSQIVNLVKDLARALSVLSIRVVETIPGKSCMGLEIPNPKRQTVRLSEILGSEVYGDMGSPITLVLGKDIAGKPVVADLARMPHLLVAGTTGSGKSVAINAMILSLLYKATANEVRVILVDPKMLELSVYEGIPHLLAPVVVDMKQAAYALNWCVAEMERRYKLMSNLGVRNLSGYNQKVRDAKKAGTPLGNPFSLTPENPEPLDDLPLIVVVIDELADLMMVVGKKVEELIARLAQKARAAGIHLILATQRPSVDVITGLIKANIPTRIAFQVSSKIDSRTILDQMGAETLLGQGDMLYLPPGTGLPQRVHGAFVADEEVHKVVEYLKSRGQPQYIEGILDGSDSGEEGEGGGEGDGGDAETDPLYDEAVAIVLKSRRASISLVQRHLRIGYNRAARLIEQMERAGLVSSMATNGNREVLVPARSES